MALFRIPNIALRGIAACVPAQVEENRNYAMPAEEMQTFINNVGVERRHIAPKDVCTSDLCLQAAEQLISDLQWEKSDIQFLLFVTQTPDYACVPATSCILQDRLGLSKECFTQDIALGCSGWVVGLSTIASLLEHYGKGAKGLLLCGDTPTKTISFKDKSAWPLFGDAGTATAVEYDADATDLLFNFNTDGRDYDVIIMPHGGARNPIIADSLVAHEVSDGIVRNDTQLVLDGSSVFSFGITKVPKSVKKLVEHFALDTTQVDYFLMHQANMMMNEKIRTKLGFTAEQCPYSMRDFGNTSSASIPLTLVTQVAPNADTQKHLRHIACGFGVGLSWGSVYFETENLVCSPLVMYNENV